MTETPSFPPLFQGVPTEDGADPFEMACTEAAVGCDAGLVAYDLGADRLRAAIVFAPDVPLEEAMAMLPMCGVGFQNALGALAPPEVAVHLDWDGGVRVNGGKCGQLRAAASDSAAQDVPNWLVIGLDLSLWPEDDDTGNTPEQTALYAEGCADVDAVRLLGSWVKHTLVGINRWSDEGVKPLHKDWRGLAHGIGETVQIAGHSGTFLGVDERFGMLISDDTTTHLVPLTHLLHGA